MKFFVLLAISFRCLCFVDAQPAPLHLTLTAGQTYYQATVSDIQIHQEIDGSPFDMQMAISGMLAYRVLSTDGHVYQIEVTYKNVGMSVTVMGETMMYSSEKNDTADIASIILSEMTKYPFRISLSDRGKVLSVMNINDWLAPTLKRLSGFSEDLVGTMLNEIMKSYSEAAFKGNIEMVSAIFPEKPVSAGDTWEVNTMLNSTIVADIHTIYTLSQRDDKQITITGEGVIQTNPNDDYTDLGVAKVKYDMTGTMRSSIQLDPATGWIVSSTFDQELKGINRFKPNMEDMPDMPDMIVPMEMKSRILISNQ